MVVSCLGEVRCDVAWGREGEKMQKGCVLFKRDRVCS